MRRIPLDGQGLQDRALLAVLLGCGLRRESAPLTAEHLQQREGRWVIVDLVGKRNKDAFRANALVGKVCR